MDIAVTNPFVVGRYISDKYFCDREQETDFLIKQIENGRNVALISPRRLGKSLFCNFLFVFLKRSASIRLKTDIYIHHYS